MYLKELTSTVWVIAFSPNGEYLAGVSDDLTVRLWKCGGKGSEINEVR
jgi:WD40 repeat protein